MRKKVHEFAKDAFVVIIKKILSLPCFVCIWAMSNPWEDATLLKDVCVVCGLFQVFLLLLVWFNAELA